MKQIQEIKSDFEQILEEVIKINGIPVESATQVAQVILQESGKFQRTEMMNQARQNGSYNNGNQQSALNNNGNGNNNGGKAPATDKQKNAMDNFGIEYGEDITKAEASALLEKAIAEVESKRNNSNKKGRVITAPLYYSKSSIEKYIKLKGGINKMCNTNIENLEIENPDIWDYCFECGAPLSKDMKEDEDWFNIRNCGESFPICKECHDKAERGELDKDETVTQENLVLNDCKAVRTMQGDWTKASNYFKEFHLNTNGAKYASSNGVAIYGYDRDKPFGDRALFNFEAFDKEIWIEVELSAEKAEELDKTVEELNRAERELREKENAICAEVARLVDEDIDKAIEKIVKSAE